MKIRGIVDVDYNSYDILDGREEFSHLGKFIASRVLDRLRNDSMLVNSRKTKPFS